MGVLIEERPESSSDSPLHRDGERSFRRIRIAQECRWRQSGVYVLTWGDAVRHVGQRKSLTMIWNFVGRISPSAVRRKGGRKLPVGLSL